MPHSLSNKTNGGPEIRTATLHGSANTGGLSEDENQLEADDARRIVAIQGGKNSNEGFVELSFSSTANMGPPPVQDEDRSGTLFVLGGNGDSVEFGDWDGQGQYIEWDEGEEIHQHEINNTGAGIRFHVTIYYVEERDC